ncbi:MAG TPA: biotin/lipoyl-binding protein [Acidimicrobiia bacterium]|nr:biotin/lipoyl-binding protein [Acidimicrobiia bacterium]
MSRAFEPEPAAPTSPAGPDEARPTGPIAEPSAGPPRLRWMRQPYVLVPAVVAVAVVVGLAMGALGDPGTASSPTAQVVTVTRGPMTESVSAEGTVAAAQSDDLKFGASGTVTAVNVKAGDDVQAGQLLATIDSAQLQANAASAQSAVARAQAQLDDDRSSGVSADRLAVDESSVAAANNQLTSAQTALGGASLVATFDGVVSQVNVTPGEQLASNGTGGTSATGSATGSGSSSASNGSSGTGSSGANGGGNGRNGGSGGNGATNGSSSSSSSSSSSASSSSAPPDVQVVSKDSYVVQLPVASADVQSVKVGQNATLTVTASASTGGFGGGRFPGFFPGGFGGNGGNAARGNGQRGTGQGGANPGGTGQRGGSQAAAGSATATGTVTDVAQVATASSGVAQYPVTVAFTAGSKQIFVGSTVTGAIATNTRADVLQVPARAVTTTNGSSTVTVRSNGRDETRAVRTGLTASGMVEITQGLKEGEQVVIRLPAGFGGTGSAPGGGNVITRGGAGGPPSGNAP